MQPVLSCSHLRQPRAGFTIFLIFAAASEREGGIMRKALNLAVILVMMGWVAAAQTVPSGTRITIRTGSALSSGTARTGQAYQGTLARDLVAGGKTIAKAGAPRSEERRVGKEWRDR